MFRDPLVTQGSAESRWDLMHNGLCITSTEFVYLLISFCVYCMSTCDGKICKTLWLSGDRRRENPSVPKGTASNRVRNFWRMGKMSESDIAREVCRAWTEFTFEIDEWKLSCHEVPFCLVVLFFGVFAHLVLYRVGRPNFPEGQHEHAGSR